MNKLTLLLPLIILYGCANPINQKTAGNYYAAGERSLYQGNLPHAAQMFERALVNVRLGHMDKGIEGQVLAKLGRTYGNMCRYTEAERSFLEAISLYEQVYGEGSSRTFPARLELAQFSYDIGWYAKAVAYFKEALPMGEEQLKVVDPLGYSEVMMDYADALYREELGVESTKAQMQAAKYKGKVGTAKITESEYIRYPKECS